MRMRGEQDISDATSRWALPASVATHLLVIALLVYGLPHSLFTPQADDAIKVEVVPPPKPSEQKEAPQPKHVDKKVVSPAANPTARSALNAMRPVMQFGDRDSGPRKSTDGNRVQLEQAVSPNAKAPGQPEPKPDAAKAADILVTTQKAGNTAAEPVKPAEPAKSAPLAKAEKLFSTEMTSNPVAMAAIGKIPRDRRGGVLCGTELREQLIRGSPPYFPDILPSARLESGNVIEVQAAFHSEDAWRAVSFQCTVDSNATKVVGFALTVGRSIPRSEWQSLGLPSQ